MSGTLEASPAKHAWSSTAGASFPGWTSDVGSIMPKEDHSALGYPGPRIPRQAQVQEKQTEILLSPAVNSSGAFDNVSPSWSRLKPSFARVFSVRAIPEWIAEILLSDNTSNIARCESYHGIFMTFSTIELCV